MENHYLKNTFNILFTNFKTFLLFEFIFKVLLSLILLPIGIWSFNSIMKFTGYHYLTAENIGNFLFNPVTFLLVLLLFVIISFLIIFDISTMIVIFDESYHKNKIRLVDAIKISFSKCKKIFHIRNILVCFLVLFLLPFLSIGIESVFITSIKIPVFVTEYILKNQLSVGIYVGSYIALLIGFFEWLFSLHYMILEDKNFKNARKCSSDLIHKHMILDYFKIFFGRILFVVLFLIVLIFGYGLIVFCFQLFSYFQVSKSAFVTLVWVLLVILILSFLILSNGVSYAIISALYYEHKYELNEKVHSINAKMILKNNKNYRLFPYFVILLCMFSMLGGACFISQVTTGKTNFNIEFFKELEITAHRGASLHYPENTMAAFQGAKMMGADWIELDVQQTKDGRVVVSHDTNLYRVSGVDKYIYDLKYDEIKKIDVGSFYGKEFSKERVPLLSDVIFYAKENGIRLNIEIKPTGHETDLEKQVVDMIHEYHFQNLCVVASQSYGSIEKVKEYSDDIMTVYVSGVEYKDYTSFTAADAFSIDANFVTSDLVHQIHAQGKELYVWTINTEEDIQRMIDMNVDNIITDNIELCREVVVKQRSSNFVQSFIDYLGE